MRSTLPSSVPPPPAWAPPPPHAPSGPQSPGMLPTPEAGTGTYGAQAASLVAQQALSDVSYQVCSSSGTQFNLKVGQYAFHASADDNAGNHAQSPEIVVNVGDALHDAGSGAAPNFNSLASTRFSAFAGLALLLILVIFVC